GGPVRDRLQLYWSHCGSYRARHADRIREWAGVDPVRSLDDIVALGEEVRRKGFKGLKTNLIRFDRDKPYMYGPGTGNLPGFPELNADHHIVDAAVAQLEAFRRGAGRDVGLHLDTNFNYKIDGYIKLARALEPLELVWLEIDLYDPAGLALIRRSARTPISSCESLYGRRQFRPYFENQSVDFAIIDVTWNGILESMKIAAMADAYEVNVAPHNFNGHLGSLISAHMCAVVPNLRVMEIDINDVTWKDDCQRGIRKCADLAQRIARFKRACRQQAQGGCHPPSWLLPGLGDFVMAEFHDGTTWGTRTKEADCICPTYDFQCAYRPAA